MNIIAYTLKAIEGVPAEFQLLPYGQIDIEGEAPAVVDGEGARSVIEEFKRRGNDMVIDYEHQTLGGGQAPAAGWIKSIVDKGKEGIHVVVEWTEKAKEYLANKEYKYFSPVMWLEKATRRVVKIENVALTNFPKVNNLKPIIAKMNQDVSLINHQTKKEGKDMLEKLKKLLGLAADAAEDAVSGAVELLVAKVKQLETVVACKEVLEAVGAKADATKEQVVQIIGSLKETTVKKAGVEAELVALKKDHEGLKKKWDERTAEELIAKALSTGRITPAQVTMYGKEMALKRPDEFTRVVLSRREGSEIPLKDLPPGGGDLGGKASEKMEKIVAKMQTDDKTLTYTAALAKAQAENPVLAREVANEVAALRGK
jgi:phage I-like protein